MAAHRRPRQRPFGGGGTARTAFTVVLAGAAGATGFSGTGVAAPELTPAQVKAKVDRLYREAEVATEKYNGAEEKATKAADRLDGLQDEAARRTERLNSERDALGSLATAQYRDGGVDPSLALLLSSDPDRYLDGAAFAERAGSRQASTVARVRSQLRDIERLRGAAHVELTALEAHRADLKRHKKAVTGKLSEARRLLSRLPEADRARIGADDPDTARASRAGSAPRGLGAGSSTAAPDSRAAAAVSYAYGKLGSPYVWGATGPDAFDCSGLMQAAYRSAGIELPRTTYAQIDAGRRVSRSELRPGDLVFFYSGISHVGMYVGNGQMVHAPNPSAPVRVAPIDEMPFAGATRVV
ncbi:C40 family peptidase [Streptomyces apricus]|uniref:NlpC/P60 family protein n=1 Tax=Streptomyces apricus TaxID=1828112 RepID=A0A5B0B450_9ACTN|nr:C40 family peptidase [Streptomyces apricus]KAA0935499.1 NlpC/P60 family protein [Streptomyces apricus]